MPPTKAAAGLAKTPFFTDPGADEFDLIDFAELIRDFAMNRSSRDAGAEDTESVVFGGMQSTTGEDLLAHAHGADHSHQDEHVHDETEDLFGALADGKPAHAGGGKTKETPIDDGSTDGGTVTKGNGKGKNKETTDDGGTTGGDTTTEETTGGETTGSDTTNGDTTSGDTTTGDSSGGDTTGGDTTTGETAGGDTSSQEFGWLDVDTYISGGDTPDGFNVELQFHGVWTDSQKDIAALQAEYLSDVFIGDMPDFGAIDDAKINLYHESIDGTGGTYGQGGWMQLRDDYAVAEGGLRLDSADTGNAESWGILDDLFLHEMLHAIGFGTTWTYQGLISGNSFIGENAMNVYGGAVPLDGSGAHWSESALGGESGSQYVNDNEIMSDLTLAAFEDMGYDTIYEPEQDLLLA